jgi:hypothetical protein
MRSPLANELPLGLLMLACLVLPTRAVDRDGPAARGPPQSRDSTPGSVGVV